VNDQQNLTHANTSTGLESSSVPSSSPHLIKRTEQALEAAVAAATSRHCPPKLAAAIRYVVFPAGGLVRPSLCFAVAGAYSEHVPPLVDATAASLELLHCASLVHDDLPCFDDAMLRRGRLTLHRAFGEELAVLVGDALIIAAFRNMATAPGPADRVVAVLQELSRGTGSAEGITAGQAWESEDAPDPLLYRRLKTGALFESAMVAGALASGADGEPWRLVGSRLGEAYQIADDLSDRFPGAIGGAAAGKLGHRDTALGRPNAAVELGQDDALKRLGELIEAGCEAVPACPGASRVRDLLRQAGARLYPACLPSN